MAVRRLLPKPKEPPEGYMLFYRRVMPISVVEDYAKMQMSGFDKLPSETRFALNCAPSFPSYAGKLVGRFGDRGAANLIFKSYWKQVFKSRDGQGVHP